MTVRPGVPVDIDRDTAQRAAERELARQEYAAGRPSPLVRAWQWLLDEIGDFIGHAAHTSPDGYLGLIALVIALVLVVVAIRLRLGRIGRSAVSSGVLFGEQPATAADHRRAADAHASSGEWALAVRERLRAVVRELEERDLLAPRAGRTAAELAVDAGHALPGHTDQLRRAADLFADVWYGGRPATPEMDAILRDLDDAARTEARTAVRTAARTEALTGANR